MCLAYRLGFFWGYNTPMSSQPCPDGPLKGSRLQLRAYLAEHQGEFDESLLKLLRGAGTDYSRLEWVSPVKSTGFAEYRDADFLRQLGLSHLVDAFNADFALPRSASSPLTIRLWYQSETGGDKRPQWIE
jgi:hypothetical protein